MKKRGFTLIEMLIVILLIGIVLVIAIPAVRNLTYNSTEKKYKQLETVVLEAAKLYTNNYQGEIVDINGDCFNIPYENLINESLIEEEDIKCSGYVVATRREKRGYNYEPYLTCKNKNGKVVYDNQGDMPKGCQGFGRDFKLTYELYTDTEYKEAYNIGDWERYVYGVYHSESPYGTKIDRYEYSKDQINWTKMTGNKESYTNYNGNVYVRAVDENGTVSSSVRHLVRTDSMGPSFLMVSDEHAITENGTLLVSVSNLIDKGVGVDESDKIYSFDGGTTWVNNKSKEYLLASTGEVRVKDKLANVTTQPISIIKACSGNYGATATEDKILTGYSAWVNGNKLTGTMPNNGTVNKTLNPGGSYTIPKGYHSGSGKITVSSLASNTSATATEADILEGKTAWVDGKLLTGTMANRGELNWAPTAAATVVIQAGYYSGGTLDSSGAYDAGYQAGYEAGKKEASSGVSYITFTLTSTASHRSSSVSESLSGTIWSTNGIPVLKNSAGQVVNSCLQATADGDNNTSMPTVSTACISDTKVTITNGKPVTTFKLTNTVSHLGKSDTDYITITINANGGVTVKNSSGATITTGACVKTDDEGAAHDNTTMPSRGQACISNVKKNTVG